MLTTYNIKKVTFCRHTVMMHFPIARLWFSGRLCEPCPSSGSLAPLTCAALRQVLQEAGPELGPAGREAWQESGPRHPHTGAA